MKFTFVLNQSGVVEAGLVGKVTVVDLCLLDYLRGWYNFEGAKKEMVEGRKFVWLHASRAIEELPMLLNPEARLVSRKNQLSAMIGKLRETGLVESIKIKRRLFFRLTEPGVRLTRRRDRPSPTAAKSASLATPSRDETVTPGKDGTVTSLRDEYLPAYNNESGTTETERNETPPLSPSEGEAESILAFWNSFSQLPPAQTITTNRARKIRKLLADPFWREHWRAGISRAASSSFLSGGGERGWRADFDWFLLAGSLVAILEGKYDTRPQTQRALSVSDIKAQLKAVEELIATHPANEDSVEFTGNDSREQRAELRKYQSRRKELVRRLAGEPPATGQPGDEDE